MNNIISRKKYLNLKVEEFVIYLKINFIPKYISGVGGPFCLCVTFAG